MTKKIPPEFFWGAAILIVLAALVYPAALRFREESRRAGCKNNLKNIGLLSKMYSQDYDGTWPSGGRKSLFLLFTTGVTDSPDIFVCPSSGKSPGKPSEVDDWTDYEYVDTPILDSELSPAIYCKYSLQNSKNGSTAILWTDGHVSWGQLELPERELKSSVDISEGTYLKLVHADKLQEYLRDPRLLKRLSVKHLVVIDAEGDTAAIAVPGSTRSLGMVYYTAQAGWRLPRDNEIVRHQPGKGWLIWEKGKTEQ